PSVAQPLWIMAALALNASAPPPAAPARPTNWLARMLPLPILGGAALAYFLLLFYPAVSASSALSEARRNYVDWHTEILPSWDGAESEEDKVRMGTAATRYLEIILAPLGRAVQADPVDSSTWLELAEWYAE